MSRRYSRLPPQGRPKYKRRKSKVRTRKYRRRKYRRRKYLTLRNRRSRVRRKKSQGNISKYFFNFSKSKKNQKSKIISKKKGISKAADETLRIALQAIKVVTSTTALVASAGAGGDTATDSIFLYIDAFNLITRLNEFRKLIRSTDYEELILELVNLEFKGVEYIVEKVDTLMEKNALASNLVEEFCELLIDNVLKPVATTIGSTISLILPNDGGITGVVVTEIIIAAEKNLISKAINKIFETYREFPQEWKDRITNTSKLEEYLETTCKNTRKILTDGFNDKKTVKKMRIALSAASVFTPLGILVPGGPILINGLTWFAKDSKYDPIKAVRKTCFHIIDFIDDNAKEFAIALNKIFALVIMILYIKLHCVEPDTAKDIMQKSLTNYRKNS